jgi:hypothetical protein
MADKRPQLSPVVLDSVELSMVSFGAVIPRGWDIGQTSQNIHVWKGGVFISMGDIRIPLSQEVGIQKTSSLRLFGLMMNPLSWVFLGTSQSNGPR